MNGTLFRSLLMLLGACTAVLAFLLLRAAREAAPARLELRQAVIDFGNGMVGQRVSTGFLIKNSGESTLRIGRIESDCACVAVLPHARALPPGSATRCEVAFDTAFPPGHTVHGLVIHSNDAQRPRAQVLIHGTVRSRFSQTSSSIEPPWRPAARCESTEVVVEAPREFSIRGVAVNDSNWYVLAADPAARATRQRLLVVHEKVGAPLARARASGQIPWLEISVQTDDLFEPIVAVRLPIAPFDP